MTGPGAHFKRSDSQGSNLKQSHSFNNHQVNDESDECQNMETSNLSMRELVENDDNRDLYQPWKGDFIPALYFFSNNWSELEQGMQMVQKVHQQTSCIKVDQQTSCIEEPLEEKSLPQEPVKQPLKKKVKKTREALALFETAPKLESSTRLRKKIK